MTQAHTLELPQHILAGQMCASLCVATAEAGNQWWLCVNSCSEHQQHSSSLDEELVVLFLN